MSPEQNEYSATKNSELGKPPLLVKQQPPNKPILIFVVFGVVLVILGAGVGLMFGHAKNFFKSNAVNVVSKQEDSKNGSTTTLNDLSGLDAPQRVVQKADNFTVLSQIVSNYYNSHTYIGKQTGADDNIYVCGDMACDVWDMVQNVGINAKISIGNVDADIKSLLDANHAWVLAEVIPGKWLALETTAGYVIRRTQNIRYYKHIHCFRNPKEFREYVEVNHSRDTALKKFAEARNELTNAHNEYERAFADYQLASADYQKAGADWKQYADLAPLAKNINELNQLDFYINQKSAIMNQKEFVLKQKDAILNPKEELMKQKFTICEQRKTDLIGINRKLTALLSEE